METTYTMYINEEGICLIIEFERVLISKRTKEGLVAVRV
jgi:hypothetical protein